MKTWMLALVGMFAWVTTAAGGPEERIAEIRKWYAAIDGGKPSKERRVAFEADDEPFSGSMVVRDFADGLSSVTVSYVAGDHGGADEHYYFKDGVLFFVFEVEQAWQFAPGGTPEQPKTVDRRKESRYYYEGSTCIRQLEREAESGDADKLAAIIAKLEQKEVEPGDESTRMRRRGLKLAKAGSAEQVMAAFE